MVMLKRVIVITINIIITNSRAERFEEIGCEGYRFFLVDSTARAREQASHIRDERWGRASEKWILFVDQHQKKPRLISPLVY